MPKHTLTFHLDVPPERVFDYIADVRNEAEWSPEIKSVEKVGDEPVGDGTVFETVYRGFGRLRIVLTEYRRPEHLFFDCEGPRIHMDFAMDVAPADGGSSVTMLVEMRLRGVFKLLTPVLAAGLPREMAKRPAQFSAVLQ